jgi:hypothetical protein
MFGGGLMLGSIRISSHSLSAFLYLIYLCTVVGYGDFFGSSELNPLI